MGRRTETTQYLKGRIADALIQLMNDAGDDKPHRFRPAHSGAAHLGPELRPAIHRYSGSACGGAQSGRDLYPLGDLYSPLDFAAMLHAVRHSGASPAVAQKSRNRVQQMADRITAHIWKRLEKACPGIETETIGQSTHTFAKLRYNTRTVRPAPTGIVELFLDNRYVDDYIERRWPNMIVTEPAKPDGQNGQDY